MKGKPLIVPTWDQLKQMSKDDRYAFLFDYLRHSLSAQIKAIRLSRGMTNGELARRADASLMTIWRYQKSWNRQWTLNVLLRIAAAFECALIFEFVVWSTVYREILTMVIRNDGIDIRCVKVPQTFTEEDAASAS